jgi:hypothetical protein
LDKVRKVFDLNWGDDAVFRMKNGAPKIMTKFKDKPYSYKLLPEYANGSKKISTVKSMNWDGKSATAKVIRGFTDGKMLRGLGHLEMLPAARWGKCILEYTGVRGKHETHGISHPRWHILLESTADGCQIKLNGTTIRLSRSAG